MALQRGQSGKSTRLATIRFFKLGWSSLFPSGCTRSIPYRLRGCYRIERRHRAVKIVGVSHNTGLPRKAIPSAASEESRRLLLFTPLLSSSEKHRDATEPASLRQRHAAAGHSLAHDRERERARRAYSGSRLRESGAGSRASSARLPGARL